MKRAVSISLIIIFLFGALVLPVSAGESKPSGEKTLEIADGLGLENTINIGAETVSRLEFTVMLMQFLAQKPGDSSKSAVFSDVKGEYSSLIDTAAEMDIAAKQDSFEPGRPILYAEALKMCVVATGYSVRAAVSGGYPSGVLKAANDLKLGKNAGSPSWDSQISGQQALTILYNTVNTDMMIQTSFGETTQYEKNNGDTILKQYFDVERIEGVVKANSRTSLSAADGALETGHVRINGQIYAANNKTEALIGYNVEAFVRETSEFSKTVIAAFGEDNSELLISGCDITEFKNGKLYYKQENGRKSGVNIDENYDFLYNGKAADGVISMDLLEQCDGIVLVDNNDDNKYDVLLLERAKHLLVGSVDVTRNAIYDESPYRNSLEFSDDSDFFIYDDNNEEIPLYKLETGVVLSAVISTDGLYAQIYPCTESVIGSVQAVDADEKIIKVADNEYKMAADFIDMFAGIGVGSEGEFVLDRYGRVVCFIRSGSDISYGYMIRILNTDDLEVPCIRMLNTIGKIELIELAEKVIIDTKGYSQEEACDVLRAASSVSSLVRYRLNTEGQINLIDTATVSNSETDMIDMDIRPEGNSLTLYDFKGDTSFSSYMYKSTGLLFPKANLSSAKLFIVPEDTSAPIDDRDYIVTDSSFFDNDTTMSKASIQLFDIDKYGTAACAVFFGEADRSPGTTFDSAVIEKVSQGIDEDGLACKKITVVQNRAYSTYILDPDINELSLKSSGKELCAGDIIRFYVNDGYIRSIVVDFDANPNVMAKNALSSAYFNSVVSTPCQYQSGKVYSVKGTQMLLTPQPSNNAVGSANYNFGLSTLKNVIINSVVIKVTMQCTTDGSVQTKYTDVRPADVSEIRSYLSGGEAADYAVVRQYGLACRVVVIYRIETR